VPITEPVCVKPVAPPARGSRVGDLHRARLGEQHVAGLHVSVHDAAAMGECERRSDLGPMSAPAGFDRSFGMNQLAQHRPSTYSITMKYVPDS